MVASSATASLALPRRWKEPSTASVALDLDHTLRIIDLGRAVPEIERQLPKETRDWLSGFVSGINHCLLRTDAALPHEFALFDLEREPWTIADILTLGRLFASDLMWLGVLSVWGVWADRY